MSRRGPPGRDLRCSLLVRNLGRGVRPDDLRYAGEKFGRLRDVYLRFYTDGSRTADWPRDFYTGEPRGIGFLEYLDPRDAEDARDGLDRALIAGREVTVVFAQQGRKAPEEYRARRSGGGGGYGGRRRSYSPRRRSYSPRRRRSPSRSPSRGRSRSPRRTRRSRSASPSRSPAQPRRSEGSDRSRGRSEPRSKSPSRSRSPPRKATRSPSRD